jgi:hypothetical protein
MVSGSEVARARRVGLASLSGEWNSSHPWRADAEEFRRDVLPALQGVRLRELARPGD